MAYAQLGCQLLDIWLSFCCLPEVVGCVQPKGRAAGESQVPLAVANPEDAFQGECSQFVSLNKLKYIFFKIAIFLCTWVLVVLSTFLFMLLESPNYLNFII